MSRIYRVIVTPEAEGALEVAYRWIEEQTPARANAWLNGFLNAIESLSTMPTRCSLASETVYFDREIRQLLFGKRGHRYRALFTVQDDIVIVLYIRHSAQEWVQPEGE